LVCQQTTTELLVRVHNHLSHAMAQSSQKAALAASEYNIGWITIKPESELVAARLMLDEVHKKIQISGDPFTYYPGKIGEHNVVISCSGEAGKHQAAECAVNMMRTFKNIKIGLLSGIGGGVPSPKHDIRLGDVVVGMPDGVYGGVAVYDSGKMTAEGYELKFHLNCSPTVVRQTVGGIQADTELGFDGLVANLEGVRLVQYKSCDGLIDKLYDNDLLQTREPRDPASPAVHHGLIACGDWVVKDAEGRSELVRRVKGDVLCFEMEAAGLMNTFPCLVVRGISDYCDKHKNGGWHRYASATAAAYCKWVLQELSPVAVGVAETAASMTGIARGET
jgi:nucleoside phosphorylase